MRLSSLSSVGQPFLGGQAVLFAACAFSVGGAVEEGRGGMECRCQPIKSCRRPRGRPPCFLPSTRSVARGVDRLESARHGTRGRGASVVCTWRRPLPPLLNSPLHRFLLPKARVQRVLGVVADAPELGDRVSGVAGDEGGGFLCVIGWRGGGRGWWSWCIGRCAWAETLRVCALQALTLEQRVSLRLSGGCIRPTKKTAPE